MKPIRVQRKRTKGWKMPPNTVYVGRPTIYGNPFKIDKLGRSAAMELYENWIYGKIYMEAGPRPLSHDLIKQQLKGKNLACFCSEKEKCHADILLTIANE